MRPRTVLTDHRAAARLTQGGVAGGGEEYRRGAAAAPGGLASGPDDPQGLTLTFGVGPRVFAPTRGLADRRPRRLVALPRFANDALDPARSDGDLCIQGCAEDPMVLVHAVRALTGLAEGIARPRWMQRGFGASTTSRASGETPRN